jgi:DNA-binding NarL/FixJ family response regulator
LPLEGEIRPRKPRNHDREHNIPLPERIVLRLEELRQQTGKQSITDVVAEASELYARLRAPGATGHQRLTSRHREVLRLVANGISTKGIAARLKISVKTAEFHRAKLMRKLGVRGIAGLVRYAIRSGVILP